MERQSEDPGHPVGRLHGVQHQGDATCVLPVGDVVVCYAGKAALASKNVKVPQLKPVKAKAVIIVVI